MSNHPIKASSQQIDGINYSKGKILISSCLILIVSKQVLVQYLGSKGKLASHKLRKEYLG